VSKCPVCDGRSNDGFLCHTCTRIIKRELLSVGVRWHDLRITISRLSKIGPESERAGSSSRPNPYDVDVAALASDIRARLVGWVKLAMDEFGAALPHDTVPALCRFVIEWLPVYRKHEAASELFDEVMALPWRGEVRPMGRQVMRAIDLPSHTQVKVGPCPEAVEDEPCSGTVTATFPKDVTDPAWMECGECHWVSDSRHWDVDGERIRQRARKIRNAALLSRAMFGDPNPPTYTPPYHHVPVLLTVPDAALTWGIPERRIRKKIEQGKITRYGKRGLTLVDPKEMRSYHDSYLMEQARIGTREDDGA